MKGYLTKILFLMIFCELLFLLLNPSANISNLIIISLPDFGKLLSNVGNQRLNSLRESLFICGDATSMATTLKKLFQNTRRRLLGG